MMARSSHGGARTPRRGALATRQILPSLFLLLSTCAQIGPPPGGPEDKEPPWLAAVSPAPDAVGVPRQGAVQLRFSEWINKASAQDAVQLFPPPPGGAKLRLDGDAIDLTPGEALDSATTYILSVKGTIADLRGIPMSSGFNLRFSTGATLDSGRFETRLGGDGGDPRQRVCGLYPLAGRDRLGYLRGDSGRVDSLPRAAGETPMYGLFADSTGAASLLGIRPGAYAVLAFEDLNGNLQADPGLERIAVGSPRVQVWVSPRLAELHLTAFDTAAPRLVSAKWTAEAREEGGQRLRGSLLLRFSAPMDWPAEGGDLRQCFLLRGENAPENIPILGMHHLPDSPEFELFPIPLSPDSAFRITCLRLAGIRGRNLDTLFRETVFRTGTGPDSTPDELVPLSPRPSEADVFPATPFRFLATRALGSRSLETLRSSLLTLAGEEELKTEIRIIDHRLFEVRLPPLACKGQLISFRRKTAAPAPPRPGVRDSAVTRTTPLFSVRLAADSTFGKLRVKLAAGNSHWFLSLKKKPAGFATEKKLLLQNEALLDSLPAGTYRASAFLDRNGNGRWDAGNLDPWTAQEPFHSPPDSIVIRAGETADLTIPPPTH